MSAPPLLTFVAGLAAGLLLCPLLPPLLRVLRMERTNFRGLPLGTGAGLLFILAAVPCAAGPSAESLPAWAAIGYGALGFLDDRWGTAEFKGLRGHLGALRRGRVTTGLLKLVGGVALALILALRLRPLPEALVSGALAALAANSFNLLDLRPLRVLKAFWLLGVPLAAVGGAPLMPVWLGLSLPYGRLEARRVVMLGDTGANALGGALGIAAASVLPLAAQAAAALALLAFHLWAEKHSLTRLIDGRPWLRRLDGWGWRGRDE